ncbi:ATP-binding protein [Sulfurovum sp. ST-21]|uniref:histidine kinase n=1 Tax=Sulfurovum indicum TaxID=2779528 RepID=A0A7M1S2F2_9BACT|nr:HAMP domain-containing sensor histidine kinase [Sulfurovum indicum]QOR61242.1 HAMP domain-containing histidine kinase [Sulfurovum indicum]
MLFWFGGVSAVLLILFSFSFYYVVEQSITLKIQNQLYKQAIQAEDKLTAGESIDHLLQKELMQGYEAAVFREGKLIGKSRNFHLKNPEFYLDYTDRFVMLKSEKYLKGVYVLTLSKPFIGKLIVTTHEINNTIEDIIDTLLALIPVLLLILLFLGSKLIDKILVPLRHITKTANEISVNNFSGTIALPDKEDEIKALVEAFNEMIVRLKEGVENLNRFNSDVSHELRTPLTAIKGEIEITLRKLREPDEYIQSLQSIAYEAEQIEHIVENLLLLTKYTKENIDQTFELCHLDAMVLNVLEKYDALLKAKELELNIQILEPVATEASSILLSIIFTNLIDNALKYTPNRKSVSISLYRKDNRIHFIIKDEGIGISKEKVSKVTDRFYRVDSSRNKKIKGFGLGLSLVKKSVELHNGEMHIASVLNEGTTVHIVL